MTRQYEQLPYPQVKEEELIGEEDYYKRVEDLPSNIYPSHILHKLNHFYIEVNKTFS